MIQQPIDFLATNHYFSGIWGHDEQGQETHNRTIHEKTGLDWPIYPQGLRDMLLEVTRRYGKRPLYISENGVAYMNESVEPDGKIHDSARIDYLCRFAAAAGEALEKGADLRGYFVWTLLDNFEWGYGYAPRFGIVRVDFSDQKRTVKDSGYFYAEVAKSNQVSIPSA